MSLKGMKDKEKSTRGTEASILKWCLTGGAVADNWPLKAFLHNGVYL